MAKPSSAQAKFLARCWGNDLKPPVIPHGYIDPTTRACIKHGWLSPTDERGTHPNGDEYIRYALSHDGLRALARALQ
jgi:hypothetical protein